MKEPQTNLHRSLRGNFFGVGEFSSQAYIIVFIEKLANSVFAESAIRHTVALQDHKYLSSKRKTLSEIFLCDVCIQLSDLQLYFLDPMASPVFVESEN